MINTFDVKANSRKSDVVFDSLNRLHDAKLSGALKSDELSKIIIYIGDLFANKIKQAKLTEDQIESAETYLTGFVGTNKDKYFSLQHDYLDRAAKIFLEGNAIAIETIQERSISVSNSLGAKR